MSLLKDKEKFLKCKYLVIFFRKKRGKYILFFSALFNHLKLASEYVVYGLVRNGDCSSVG
jgi:hypothetical protein